MKSKSAQFVCNNCGAHYGQWLGRCTSCNEWNTVVEFHETTQAVNRKSLLNYVSSASPAQFSVLRQTSNTKGNVLKTPSGFAEIDRVLGGGFHEDEVILISGEPGVGKSTLLLSILGKIGEKLGKTVYISSEEEGSHIEHRAARLGVNTAHILFSAEKNINSILSGLSAILTKEKIPLLIFDSIQGLYSDDSDGIPGAISQQKSVLMKIVEFSKSHHVISLVVGHITKEGDIAGPKFLEHMVDCVLFLEGDRMTNIRILRSFKNRFGGTEEVGFFEMKEAGMTEVSNPSEYFLDEQKELPGKATIAVRQGIRILFASVECLAVSSVLPFPKRVAQGIDTKRLELILAIEKKYLHIPADKFDIYVSVSGGLRVTDTLADLGVAAAVYSSISGKAVRGHTAFVGEVGLLGNVRRVSVFERIAREAKRLGFKTVHSSADFPYIAALKKLL